MQNHRPSSSRRRRVAAAVALGAALGLGACGGDDATDASEDPPSDDSSTTDTTAPADGGDSDDGEDPEEGSDDPCDIVSDEVVSDILGVEIARREPATDANGSGCIKGTERMPDPRDGAYVSASFVTGGAAIVDSFSAQEGSEAVSGLGDRAVYVPNVGSLTVALGDDALQIQVYKEGVPGTQDEVVRVANAVLDRR